MWESMKNIATNVNSMWLVAGDFNDIAFANEKKGGALASMQKCKTFRDNMEVCNLEDLQTKGPFLLGEALFCMEGK